MNRIHILKAIIISSSRNMNHINSMVRCLFAQDKPRKSSASSQSSEDKVPPMLPETLFRPTERLFDPNRGVRILCYDTARSSALWLHLFMTFIVCSAAWFFFIFWSQSVLLSDKVILRDNFTACGRIWHDSWLQEVCGDPGCPCTKRSPCIKTLSSHRFYNIDVSYYGIWVFTDEEIQGYEKEERWFQRGWRWCKTDDADCRECQIQKRSKDFYRWKNSNDVPFFTPYKLLTLAIWSVSAGIIFVTLVGYQYMAQYLQGSVRRWLNRFSVFCGVLGAIFLMLMPLSPMNRVQVIENDFMGRFHMSFAKSAFMLLSFAELFMISATWNVVRLKVSLWWSFTLIWVAFSSSLWLAWLGSVHEWLAVAAIFSYFLPQCVTGYLNWRDSKRDYMTRPSLIIRFSKVAKQSF